MPTVSYLSTGRTTFQVAQKSPHDRIRLPNLYGMPTLGSVLMLVAALVLMASIAGQAYAQSDEKLVRLETSQGEIIIELFVQDAPNHVDNFVHLVESGFYDGTVFHRVINNFLIQGGDPNTISGDTATWGTGGSEETIESEFNDIRHHRGIVSMTRAGDPNSASSQFFIVLKDANFLNGQYTVFGRVATEDSFQALEGIATTPIGAEAIPLDPEQVRIISASVVSRSEVADLLDLPGPERTNPVMGPLTDRQILENIPYGLDFDATSPRYPSLGVKVEVVADNLVVPWSIDWIPDGTMLFTERGGNLRYIQNGVLIPEPLLTISANTVEGGLLGIAVDPNFQENNYIYLYYTYDEPGSTNANKVVRYTFIDGSVAESLVLIEDIPGGAFHDGGRIQFGPDGRLYIATGDGGYPDLAQDIDSLAGKILRINPDGTVPGDNPFEGSPVWSLGHRNPQGMDWDGSGNLVITEHGPSGWRGVAHDELNLIIPGANYGWPAIIGDEEAADMQTAIFNTGNDTWAPSGAEFYEGDKIPQWTGKYFVATLRGSHLHMVDLDLQENTVISHSRLFQDEFGRLRDVQTGPDGYLYLLTSNHDGRGTAGPNDDRILRVVPLSESDVSGDIFEGGIASYERTIVVDGTEYYIGYEMTGGRLLEIAPDADAKSLIVSVDATSHGSLTLAIPRTVADAKVASEYGDYRVPEGMLQFGRDSASLLNDLDYVILVDGEVADFEETASAATRTLTIGFSPETKVIEIVGTFVQAPADIPHDEGSPGGEAASPVIGGVDLSQASPRLGSADASVTIIEFGDYQCPRCKSWFDNTKPQIDSNYIDTGLVNLYYVDVKYIGGDSHTASIATYCAQDQGMYWEYHNILFENQGGVHSGWASASNLAGFAEDIGLDTTVFESCLQSSGYRERLDFNAEQGRMQGVGGTPHFIIVGPEDSVHIRGPQPYSSFEATIQELLN